MERTTENGTGIDHLKSTKRLLLWKLEKTIESVLSSSACFVDNQISGDLTQTLCTVIEAIFIHGLRDAFFLKGSRHSNKPSPNFWPFVSKYTHRSIKAQISTLNQIHTEIGRARAWVRIVLNEHTLDHYISMFVKDTKQMNQFYADSAFLRDSEYISSLDDHLKRLNVFRMTAPTNSSILNTWTPSPLSLAGIIKAPLQSGATATFHSAAVPTDVPSLSPTFNGPSTGPGFKVGSSSPSASSSVLLPDEVAIASGEQQIVAEFGMSADLLLLEEGEQCEEKQIVEPADEQRQLLNSSASMAMADDLESVYSHPSMLEDHHYHFGTFDQHQRWPNVHPKLFSTTFQHSNNNKWMMAAMPAEELSNEVIVYRKAAQRHRRRTVSKSSGGDSANGSSSRCHSNANLRTFEEQSVEDKGAGEDSDRGREAKFAIDECPPLGTSLHDELLLASAVAGATDNDEFVVGELARKKFSATDEHQPLANDLLTNSKIVYLSGKVSVSCSTDSIDKLHEPISDGLPATFDEALRDFLDREAMKRGRSRARTSSSTTNRLFSECSSFSAGATVTDQQQNSPANLLAIQSPSPTTTTTTAGDDYACGGLSVRGEPSSKRGSAATMTAFLFRSKELPSVPFKREKGVDSKKHIDAEEELVTIPVPSSGNPCSQHHSLPLAYAYHEATSSSMAVADDDKDTYRLPRRLCRLTQIPTELGLDAHEFRCASCRRNIGASFGPFNVCALNGRYYCVVGHCIRAKGASASTNDDGGVSLIPARVMLNGDFRPRIVSRESRTLLRFVVDKPFMRLNILNPEIYAHCAMLRKIRDLRLKFSLFVLYLFSCKDSIAEDAKRRVWPHKHWHEDIHLYSIADFESVANGSMERRLNSLIIFAQCHVQGCQICLQKGFFCELCSASDQPIYPFQTETFRCLKCASVFHKECARKAGLDDCTCAERNEQNKCPKCLRRAKYAA